MWFNAYLNGCCNGGWGVASSTNGINFTLVSLNETGAYPEVDGNGLFVDDDGTGYLIYSSLSADHHVSIERLTPDFLHTAGENYGLFPDRYVEGAILFKRAGIYYVAYGSCCCFCRGGSGVVVYTTTNISGPWTRQPGDMNCNSTTASICGAYGDRETGGITISAQGIGLSSIPLADGTNALVWHGERWLSAPNNNPECPDECQGNTAICQEPTDYIKGHGFMYWIPLGFDAQTGALTQFAPFVDAFSLNVSTASVTDTTFI
jgi:beta-xylosidase